MKRILLADDEETILLAYQKLLQGDGVEVIAVDTAEMATICLKQECYDAFIVDLRIHGTAVMDGLDLVSLARKKQHSCFIVVVTAYGDKEIETNAADAGADLFLEKPVSPVKLKGMLKEKQIYSKN